MEKDNWKNKIYKKIKKETGLEEHFIFMYDFFIESSSLVDGIVMPGEVKYKLKKFINYAGDNPEKYNIERFYKNILKEFKKRELIQDYKAGNQYIYPKIIGYNYYNDEEFYFKTRTKGETNWTGRISKNGVTQGNILRNVVYKQEFENKELEQTVLN
jgi:hypothetical protein